MATLLLHLKGNKTLNRTVFPPHLYVYDDLLMYKKRNWFKAREVTIAYTQIAHVILINVVFFAHLDILTTGTDSITVKFISLKGAKMAKKLIDQKIYHAHAKHRPGENREDDVIRSYEKALARLRELRGRGKISEREYKKKRSEVLKKMG